MKRASFEVEVESRSFGYSVIVRLHHMYADKVDSGVERIILWLHLDEHTFFVT